MSDEHQGHQRREDWAPDYVHKCGVCGSTEDVVAVTEWNRGLCRRCLPDAVNRRIFNEVRRRQMIAARDRVGVAVSGGKDSAVLLAALAALRNRKPLTLVAIHVDAGIGDYSRRCVEAVEELCRRYAVRLVVERAEDYGVRADAVGPWPVCAVCGGVRRALLPRVARRENLDVLATGHSMEDMLQVMLKQIMSGRDFCPKPVLPATPYDPKKIKPLYFVPEKLTQAYADIKGLEYVPDACPHFPPDTHRFKEVFEHLERLAPMSKVQVLTNLGRLMKPPPIAERPFTCEDCGEPSRRELCPLCLVRRLQHGEPVPFLKNQGLPPSEDDDTSRED
ncbi:MAG: adenine nucleotide alpha hydrolase family protein [Armatimonadetes bacterium]|nr:adenine nucleotide alpha hydrolase family protein [Armatimonadota bacterium]